MVLGLPSLKHFGVVNSNHEIMQSSNQSNLKLQVTDNSQNVGCEMIGVKIAMPLLFQQMKLCF